jgi:hypothetical protein
MANFYLLLLDTIIRRFFSLAAKAVVLFLMNRLCRLMFRPIYFPTRFGIQAYLMLLRWHTRRILHTASCVHLLVVMAGCISMVVDTRREHRDRLIDLAAAYLLVQMMRRGEEGYLVLGRGVWEWPAQMMRIHQLYTEAMLIICALAGVGTMVEDREGARWGRRGR